MKPVERFDRISASSFNHIFIYLDLAYSFRVAHIGRARPRSERFIIVLPLKNHGSISGMAKGPDRGNVSCLGARINSCTFQMHSSLPSLQHGRRHISPSDGRALERVGLSNLMATAYAWTKHIHNFLVIPLLTFCLSFLASRRTIVVSRRPYLRRKKTTSYWKKILG
jgi:hypothetical protein